jgi:hypothetical protein
LSFPPGRLRKLGYALLPASVFDQVLPLDAEVAAALPPDPIDKVLTSQAAMRLLLHEFARYAKQVK